jgi:ABC-type phosphate/phosphonate transport system substrate-binding protein
LSHLRSLGVEPGEVAIRRFDVGVGLHGDHVGGEREAARALVAGEVDATCMIDANLLVFTNEGTLPQGTTKVLTQTAPYDHCNMTVTSAGPVEGIARFAQLLEEMAYDDPTVRPLLDLEGLKQWVPGRTSGYQLLERAVDETGFYDDRGGVHGYDTA